MADLLGSILGSMQKPPVADDKERRRRKEAKQKLEKLQKEEKQKLNKFREQTETKIKEFTQNSKEQKYKFEPMGKTERAIVHEIADVASLTSFSFGEEEEDRYVMIWKKEFAPCDEEVMAYRWGEEWDPDKAKKDARLKELEKIELAQRQKEISEMKPTSKYIDKYEHLIGKESALEAAKQTIANKSYGFVSSENKKDKRTIEEVMADNKAKRKLKEAEQSEPTEKCAKVGDTI